MIVITTSHTVQVHTQTTFLECSLKKTIIELMKQVKLNRSRDIPTCKINCLSKI